MFHLVPNLSEQCEMWNCLKTIHASKKVFSVALFFKHWRKNYWDINQLPYYAYLYKVISVKELFSINKCNRGLNTWSEGRMLPVKNVNLARVTLQKSILKLYFFLFWAIVVSRGNFFLLTCGPLNIMSCWCGPLVDLSLRPLKFFF